MGKATIGKIILLMLSFRGTRAWIPAARTLRARAVRPIAVPFLSAAHFGQQPERQPRHDSQQPSWMDAAILGVSSEDASGLTSSSQVLRTLAHLRSRDSATPGESIDNVRLLLRSNAVKGVGPKLEAALTLRFGERTLEVLRGEGSAEDEAALLALPGVGQKTLTKLRGSMHLWDELSAALDFGLSLGCLSEAQVTTLASTHGASTEERVRSDPFLLLDLFPTLRFGPVDQLARTTLGLRPNAPERARAALHDCMRRAMGNGHCCVPRARLVGGTAKALRLPELPFDDAAAVAEEAIQSGVASGHLVEEKPPAIGLLQVTPPPEVISLASMQAAERFVADAVRRRLAPPDGGYDPVFGRYADADFAPLVSSLQAETTTPLQADTATSPAEGERLQMNHAADPLDAAEANLTPTQRKAVAFAGMGNLMVLTGGPGTGKTFTVRAIVRRWQAAGKRVVLACPTARAASVLAEAVGAPASTIHRLLEYNPREGAFKRAANNPLVADAVVIDEASMLDVHLAGALFHALPRSASILIVGDDDQLPSVGPGAVLHDLLRCSRVPRVELTEVFRQDPSGDIARNARLINRGLTPQHMQIFPSASVLLKSTTSDVWRDERPSGCVFVAAATESSAADMVCNGVMDWLEASGYDLKSEVQVLTPLKKGAAGTYAFNSRLKERLNPCDDLLDGHHHGDSTTARPRVRQRVQQSRQPKKLSERDSGEQIPSVGDSMIQLTNDYSQHVFNGDIGRVLRVWQVGKALRFSVGFNVASAGAGGAHERRRRETVVEYTKSSLGKDITLSYALTVHKAQGSEYPVVVMPVLPEQANMLNRNLLYTGLSRAKKLLLLVGSEDALRRAVANDSSARRMTLLAERVDDRNFAPAVTRHMSEP